MPLFFNYEKLVKNKSPDKVMDVLYKILSDRYMGPSIVGYSYLLNPLPLLYVNIHPRDKLVYIKYAAMRSYSAYKQSKIKSLDLSLYPEADITEINRNPLLAIVNKTLKFKYEEIYGS